MARSYLAASRFQGTMVAAIVLAAGASSRLGQPKALARLEGRTHVERIIAALAEAGVDPIRVVVGADRDRIQPAVPPQATVVHNDGWRLGRTGSLKAGLRTVQLDDAFIVWPVDHPLATATTLQALLRASDGSVRIPTHRGRRGHPTWFAASLREEVLALGDDQPLRDVVHRQARRVREVPVDDPGVLLNLDTPDDLKKAEDYLRGSPDARPPA